MTILLAIVLGAMAPPERYRAHVTMIDKFDRVTEAFPFVRNTYTDCIQGLRNYQRVIDTSMLAHIDWIGTCEHVYIIGAKR